MATFVCVSAKARLCIFVFCNLESVGALIPIKMKEKETVRTTGNKNTLLKVIAPKFLFAFTVSLNLKVYKWLFLWMYFSVSGEMAS